MTWTAIPPVLDLPLTPHIYRDTFCPSRLQEAHTPVVMETCKISPEEERGDHRSSVSVKAVADQDGLVQTYLPKETDTVVVV